MDYLTKKKNFIYKLLSNINQPKVKFFILQIRFYFTVTHTVCYFSILKIYR